MKRGLVFLCLVFVCSSLAAQTDTTFNSKKEVVIKGKRFRVYNNWMNVGLGEGLNTRLPFTQTILDVDLHFHIRDSYFQLGTFLSGDRFLSFNNYNAHFCYGKRWETETRNIFVSAGPSYSWGFPYSNGVYNSYIYTAFGGYAEAQYIFKPAYDLGLGLSVFGDFNYLQAVYGIRLELFFSGAYRGEKNKRY